VAISEYEVWQEPWSDAGGMEGAITGARPHEVEDHRRKKLLSKAATLLYRIQAHSWEEAMAIHHLRMGWSRISRLGLPRTAPNVERRSIRRAPGNAGGVYAGWIRLGATDGE